MASEVEIRPSTASDVGVIANVAAELPQWFTPAGLGHIRIDAKHQPGFVAVREGMIVGFITFFVSEGIGHRGKTVIRRIPRQNTGACA